MGNVCAYCPKISTANSTIQASPIVCQNQAVASTAICRDSTRLNHAQAVTQSSNASDANHQMRRMQPGNE